jgi:hypothetical protein
MYDLTFSILILVTFGVPVFLFWGYPAHQDGQDAADLGKEAFKKFWNGLTPQQHSMIGHHQFLFWIRIATFFDIKGPQNWWQRMISDLSAEDRERMTATRWKRGND